MPNTDIPSNVTEIRDGIQALHDAAESLRKIAVAEQGALIAPAFVLWVLGVEAKAHDLLAVYEGVVAAWKAKES